MLKFTHLITTQNIIKASPHDTLSSALSKLETSHDAAFVFSDDDKFLGLINPYYSLICSSYPGNAKVEHCLFHPPKLKVNFPINKVLTLMMQSKVHFLPVFDEHEKFIGMITARRLLEALQNDPRMNVKIQAILDRKKRPLLTIYEDDIVTTAINLFKQYKVSKLIVINKDLKLRGVLSYYDLIHFLISPKVRPHSGEREGNRVSFYHHKINNFAKTYVLTLSPTNQMNTVLKMILEKKIGSVVIIDSQRRPVGIITTRDLFTLALQPYFRKKLVTLSKNFTKQSKQVLDIFFKRKNTQALIQKLKP